MKLISLLFLFLLACSQESSVSGRDGHGTELPNEVARIQLLDENNKPLKLTNVIVHLGEHSDVVVLKLQTDSSGFVEISAKEESKISIRLQSEGSLSSIGVLAKFEEQENKNIFVLTKLKAPEAFSSVEIHPEKANLAEKSWTEIEAELLNYKDESHFIVPIHYFELNKVIAQKDQILHNLDSLFLFAKDFNKKISLVFFGNLKGTCLECKTPSKEDLKYIEDPILMKVYLDSVVIPIAKKVGSNSFLQAVISASYLSDFDSLLTHRLRHDYTHQFYLKWKSISSKPIGVGIDWIVDWRPYHEFYEEEMDFLVIDYKEQAYFDPFLEKASVYGDQYPVWVRFSNDFVLQESQQEILAKHEYQSYFHSLP